MRTAQRRERDLASGFVGGSCVSERFKTATIRFENTFDDEHDRCEIEALSEVHPVMRPSLIHGALTLADRSGLLIGLVAVSFTTTAALAMRHAPTLVSGAVVFLIAMSSYALDRIADPPLHATRGETRLLVVAATLGFLGTAGIARELDREARFFLCVFPVAVALYGARWIPRSFGSRWRRLKDIPFAKAFYVAFFWAMLVTEACLAMRMPCSSTLIAASIFVYGKIFVGVVACDLKDEEADRRDGVVTFPVRLGASVCIAFLHATNVAFALVTILLVAARALPSWMLVTELHAIAFALSLHVAAGRSRAGWHALAVAVDGLFCLIGPLAALGSLTS